MLIALNNSPLEVDISLVYARYKETGRFVAKIPDLGITAYGSSVRDADLKSKAMLRSLILEHEANETLSDLLEKSELNYGIYRRHDPEFHPVTYRFNSYNSAGNMPSINTVYMVDRLVKAISAVSKDSFDDEITGDGDLEINADLINGAYLSCVIDIAGNIQAGLYRRLDGSSIKILTNATEQQVLEILPIKPENTEDISSCA